MTSGQIIPMPLPKASRTFICEGVGTFLIHSHKKRQKACALCGVTFSAWPKVKFCGSVCAARALA